jgi:hypothetical protein
MAVVDPPSIYPFAADQTSRKLVPFQGDIVMFSAPLVFRDKAQCATKTQSTRFTRGAGSGYSIGKHCNAVAEHLGSAEHDNITLKGH